MRRNCRRLTLLLLFLSGLYAILLYENNSTLQDTVSGQSVSELTDEFSIFVPIRTSQGISVNDGKNKERQNERPEDAQNLIVPNRGKAADGRKDLARQRKPQDGKFAKGVQREIKILSKRVKLRKHSAVQSNRNVGSGQKLQDISKAEVNKRHSYVPLGNSGTRLSNVTISLSYQKTQSETKNKLHANDGSWSDVRLAIPKSKVSLNQIRNQVIRPSDSNGDISDRRSAQNTSGVRVIIAAHGRSGSSFLGGIFNAHPDFFFIYEPLHKLNLIVDPQSEDYIDHSVDAVNAILTCNFENDKYLESLSRPGYHRASSRSLVSPPFCKSTYEEAINFIENRKWKSCNGHIAAAVLNKICQKYPNIASKILLERLVPADLSWILYISDPRSVQPRVQPSLSHVQPAMRASDDKIKPPVYVLYIVRDPRAMIYSRIKLGWVYPRENAAFALESGEVDDNVRKVCDTIELNLGAVLRYPRRIKLVRYEELVTNPEGMVRGLFGEMHISPSKEVFRWIHNKTHGPVQLLAWSLSRNANVSINAWREKIPNKLLEIVEMRCDRVMRYLGYLPTNGSQKILRDLNTPLYLNKIRDLMESYEWPTRQN